MFAGKECSRALAFMKVCVLAYLHVCMHTGSSRISSSSPTSTRNTSSKHSYRQTRFRVALLGVGATAAVSLQHIVLCSVVTVCCAVYAVQQSAVTGCG